MNLAEPGVGDFVLLNEVSEKAFMENLEKRFSKERIYVRTRGGTARAGARAGSPTGGGPLFFE